MLPFQYTNDGIVVTTLYVRSLAKKTKRDHLVKYFSTFGTVKNVRMYHKTATRPFGFVIFASAESAAKALSQRVHKIGNREINVNKADSWHQETPLEIQLTNVTGTHILDVNDDCLYEIFSLDLISLKDLCMVAETCTRFKDIAVRIFTTTDGTRNFQQFLSGSMDKINDMQRVFINFGPSITNLEIAYTSWADQELKLAIRYCSKTLESLELCNSYIDKKLRPMFSRLKKLSLFNCYSNDRSSFSNCAELVELHLSEFIGCDTIFENHFPKLLKFDYLTDDWVPSPKCMELFLSRHKNLKALTLCTFLEPHSVLVPVIAENCRDLETLKIFSDVDDELKYVKQLKSLKKLTKLKVLRINCSDKNVTEFVQELAQAQLCSLETLELSRIIGDAQLVPALAKLKNLNVLRLHFYDTEYLTNINDLAELEKLNELKILFYGNSFVQIDIIALVKRLVNLKKLRIYDCKMDKEMYVKLVNVVRERTNRVPSSPLVIAISNDDNDVVNLQGNRSNRQYVQLTGWC